MNCLTCTQPIPGIAHRLRRYCSEQCYRKQYYLVHRHRILERNKTFYKRNPISVIRSNGKYDFRKKYGITIEQYQENFIKQESACALCHKVYMTGRRFAVDCTVTGKFRGLLCGRCKVGLAHFNHDFELLSKAANYVRE